MSPKELIVCMKHQIIFSRKNKKPIISLSSAESAHSLVSVKALSKIVADNILIVSLFF